MATWNLTSLQETEVNKRFDSEFFQPKYVDIEEKIKNLHSESTLGQLGKFVIGPFGSAFHVSNFDSASSFRYIRGKDVKPFQLKDDDNVFIPIPDYKRLEKYSVKPQDLIISVVGTIGNVSIIPSEVQGIFSCKSTILRNTTVDPFYLLAYLNSNYGKTCLLRRQRGAIQTGLNLEDLSKVPVPIFSNSTMNNIGELVNKGLNLQKESKHLYTQAIQLLERELGLDEVDKNFKIFNTIYLSSVTCNNRVDAQCYKPEYVLYEKFLRKKGNFDSIGSLMVRATKGHQQEPTEKGSIPYVSIKDIKGVEVIAEEKCGSAPVTSQINDLLLAVTGATIGKTGINYRYDNLAFCGDLLNLEIRAEKVSPEYLLMILKSPVGQTQITRWITGSTNGHFAPTDLKKVLIPRLNPETENQISVLMKQSLMNKDQSEHLLAQAKSEVETLIEQAAQKA